MYYQVITTHFVVHTNTILSWVISHNCNIGLGHYCQYKVCTIFTLDWNWSTHTRALIATSFNTNDKQTARKQDGQKDEAPTINVASSKKCEKWFLIWLTLSASFGIHFSLIFLFFFCIYAFFGVAILALLTFALFLYCALLAANVAQRTLVYLGFDIIL